MVQNLLTRLGGYNQLLNKLVTWLWLKVVHNSCIDPLQHTCEYRNLPFMQLFHTAKDLSATVLEDDCLIMETQLAAIHIQFSLMSTLIYVETISTFQVGKFYST